MSKTFKSFEELFVSEYGGKPTSATKEKKNAGDSVKLRSYNKDTRADDDAAERKFDTFLAENIYPGIVKLGIAKEVVGVDNVEAQCNGSDAVYRTDKYAIRVDNKNRASVCNVRSRCFPIELATDDRRGNRIPGWGIKDAEKDTDYILHSHCFVDDSNTPVNFNKISMDEVSRVDCPLYKLEDVWRYLATQGLTYEDVINKSLELEKAVTEKAVSGADIEKSDRMVRICSGVCIYTSYYKVKENPTVLLVDESIISKLPHTRRLSWDKDNGLVEDLTKRYRPDLTPSKDAGIASKKIAG